MSGEMAITLDQKYMYFIQNKTLEVVISAQLPANEAVSVTFLDASGSPAGWVKITDTAIKYSCDNKSISLTGDYRNVKGTFAFRKLKERMEIRFQGSLLHNYTYLNGCELNEQAFGFTFLKSGYPAHTVSGAKFKISSKFNCLGF